MSTLSAKGASAKQLGYIVLAEASDRNQKESIREFPSLLIDTFSKKLLYLGWLMDYFDSHAPLIFTE